jgi:hypothetical protein
MKHFVDIISGIVDNFLKVNGNIISMNEISSGIYEIITDELDELLLNNQVISISNTIGFNGKFQVSSVDYDNKTYTISSTSGITIPGEFGTWKSEGIYFYAENIPAFSETLSNENFLAAIDQKKFPSILLIIPYRDNHVLRNGDFSIESATVFIFNATEPDKKFDYRHINTMPYLRLIRDRFEKGLEMSSQLVGQLSVRGQELPFFGSPDQNNLNQIMDAIRLDINDFFIFNNNC